MRVCYCAISVTAACFCLCRNRFNSTLCDPCNRDGDGFQIFNHVVVRKSHDVIPFMFQVFRPGTIRRGSALMAAAVYFDDQPRGRQQSRR